MGAYDYNGNIVVPFNYQSVKALNATHYVVQQHINIIYLILNLNPLFLNHMIL